MRLKGKIKMSKYLTVLSDTHGNYHELKRLQGDFLSSDYIIHLGDGAMDMLPYYDEFKDKIYQVNGNCDVFLYGVSEIILEVEGVRILAVHGHKFSVKTGTEKLLEYAKKKECQIALYGHTHEPKIDLKSGVYLINPGSLSYGSFNQTIARIKIENGTITPKIITLNNKF